MASLKQSMRFFVVIFVHLIFFNGSLWAQWTDDFTDGNFSSDPLWKGDTADFIIQNGILQLNQNAENQSTIFTEQQSDSVVVWSWEFSIRCQFSPSANNTTRWVLWAADSIGIINDDDTGFEQVFLQLGESGSSDAPELFYSAGEGEEVVSICRGNEGSISSAFEKTYRILHDHGVWTIYSGFWGGPLGLESSGYQPLDLVHGFTAVKLKYTASNGTKFKFNSISSKPFIPDTLPPALINAEVLNKSSLALEFSEALDSVVLNPENYGLGSSFAMPESVWFQGPDQNRLFLFWETDFIADQTQVLTMWNIVDFAGNQTDTLTWSFIWHPPFEADSAGIIITEILADPTPQISLPNAEYIELFNATDSTLNLKDYILYNSSIPLFLPAFDLGPSDYLILCKDADSVQMAAFGAVVGFETWPALVNSSDSLTLINPSGQVLDWVKYSNSWYQISEKAEGGWSLEKVNYNSPCAPSSNWKGSEHPYGGTPGIVNSVHNPLPDTLAPRIESVWVQSPNWLKIELSEVPESGFLFPENVGVSNSIVLTVEHDENQTYFIGLDDGLVSGTTPKIWLNNVADCWQNSESDTMDFDVGYFVRPGDLIFTEVMADPSPPQNLPEAEYIEIKNTSEHDLIHYRLELINSGNPIVLPFHTLAAQTYLILCANVDTSLFKDYGLTLGVDGWKQLVNSGDHLMLKNNQGEVIAQLQYSDTWHDADKRDGGWSLERIDENQSCETQVNWSSSASNQGGTPGFASSVEGEINNPIEWVQAVLLPSNQLQLSFTGEVDSSSLSIDNITIEPSLSAISMAYSKQTSGFNLHLELNEPPDTSQIYTVKINGIKTCNQDSVEGLNKTFGVAQAARPGDVVINEVLFNPFSDGTDFIELRNNSNRYIDLDHWRITYYIGEEIKAEVFLTETPFFIIPKTLMAFSQSSETLMANYPLSSTPSALVQINGFPNLIRPNGTLVLKNKTLQTMDSINYDESMHFPLLDEAKGVSLEKINATGLGTAAINWTSASELSGYATPGSPNSQRYLPQAQGQVYVEPALFTPNLDGINDQVFINYQFSDAGWMATIRLFDAKGVLIRRLLNNYWMGNEGAIPWDGTTDQGEIAPLGIYVIDFELFNALGEKQRFVTTCVLGERLN